MQEGRSKGMKDTESSQISTDSVHRSGQDPFVLLMETILRERHGSKQMTPYELCFGLLDSSINGPAIENLLFSIKCCQFTSSYYDWASKITQKVKESSPVSQKTAPSSNFGHMTPDRKCTPKQGAVSLASLTSQAQQSHRIAFNSPKGLTKTFEGAASKPGLVPEASQTSDLPIDRYETGAREGLVQSKGTIPGKVAKRSGIMSRGMAYCLGRKAHEPSQARRRVIGASMAGRTGTHSVHDTDGNVSRTDSTSIFNNESYAEGESALRTKKLELRTTMTKPLESESKSRIDQVSTLLKEIKQSKESPVSIVKLSEKEPLSIGEPPLLFHRSKTSAVLPLSRDDRNGSIPRVAVRPDQINPSVLTPSKTSFSSQLKDLSFEPSVLKSQTTAKDISEPLVLKNQSRLLTDDNLRISAYVSEAKNRYRPQAAISFSSYKPSQINISKVLHLNGSQEPSKIEAPRENNSQVNLSSHVSKTDKEESRVKVGTSGLGHGPKTQSSSEILRYNRGNLGSSVSHDQTKHRPIVLQNSNSKSKLFESKTKNDTISTDRVYASSVSNIHQVQSNTSRPQYISSNDIGDSGRLNSSRRPAQEQSTFATAFLTNNSSKPIVLASDKPKPVTLSSGIQQPKPASITKPDLVFSPKPTSSSKPTPSGQRVSSCVNAPRPMSHATTTPVGAMVVPSRVARYNQPSSAIFPTDHGRKNSLSFDTNSVTKYFAKQPAPLTLPPSNAVSPVKLSSHSRPPSISPFSASQTLNSSSFSASQPVVLQSAPRW